MTKELFIKIHLRQGEIAWHIYNIKSHKDNVSDIRKLLNEDADVRADENAKGRRNLHRMISESKAIIAESKQWLKDNVDI